MKDVDQSLKLTEAASTENVELHSIVDKMFNTINIIEQNSARNGRTVNQVTDVTNEMSASIHQLSASTSEVNSTANKLQQLVSIFKVTEKRA